MGVVVFSVTALLLEDAGRKTYNQKGDRRNMRDHRRDVYIKVLREPTRRMLQPLINIAAAEAVGVAITVMSASTSCFD